MGEVATCMILCAIDRKILVHFHCEIKNEPISKNHAESIGMICFDQYKLINTNMIIIMPKTLKLSSIFSLACIGFFFCFTNVIS